MESRTESCHGCGGTGTIVAAPEGSTSSNQTKRVVLYADGLCRDCEARQAGGKGLRGSTWRTRPARYRGSNRGWSALVTRWRRMGETHSSPAEPALLETISAALAAVPAGRHCAHGRAGGVMASALLVYVGTVGAPIQAADVPRLEVCIKYAEADAAFNAAMRDPTAVYEAAMNEAKAARGAAHDAAKKEFDAALDAAVKEAEAAGKKAAVTRDAAVKEAKAAAKEAEAAFFTARAEEAAAYHLEGHTRLNAMKVGRAVYKAAVKEAEAAYYAALKEGRAAGDAAVNKAAGAYLAAMKDPRAAADTARKEANATYEAAEQEAEAAREVAYSAIYDADDGDRSEMPEVMRALRIRHRDLCREIHKL